MSNSMAAGTAWLMSARPPQVTSIRYTMNTQNVGVRTIWPPVMSTAATVAFCRAFSRRGRTYSGVGSFHYCIAGKCGWYKDDGCVGLHKSYRFMYGVKYRHTIYKCTSFTRRSTCNNLCTVFFHFSGMESSVPPGYTLNNYSSIFIDKDAHI